MSVCVSVRPCVCSLLRYCLNVFLPPLPNVGCPIFLEIQSPWGKVMERSGLRFEYFCLKIVKNCREIFFIFLFFTDFALQNMVETTLPNGFEPSNFQKIFWSTDPYGKFLSYATLGGYVPCLGDEELKWNAYLYGKT